jgi:tellurite resistance protein TerC
MLLFWLGFFALVAMLLVLDLGVLHRKAQEPTLASSVGWTIAWVILGLSFSGVVYLIYENHWLGADFVACFGRPPDHTGDGRDAAVTYVSAYLLEQALSIDNLFVMALAFHAFTVPMKHQHRVLFWGILGAIGFRLAMLGGGAYIAHKFEWVFYIFGGFLAYQGGKLLKGGDDDEPEPERSWTVRTLRKFVRITDREHNGHFHLRIDGRFWLTTTAVCLVVIELQDIAFALDSIPAVLSVSQETFIMVTSNIFAILGLRSMYFVLAGMMAKFQYLKLSLGVLLILIGVKMILAAADVYDASHVVTLGSIALILGAGVIASVVATKRAARAQQSA